MSKTMIDIDDDLLAYAGELLGTKTKRATVETALRMATAERARTRLLARIESGELDLSHTREEGWR